MDNNLSTVRICFDCLTKRAIWELIKTLLPSGDPEIYFGKKDPSWLELYGAIRRNDRDPELIVKFPIPGELFGYIGVNSLDGEPYAAWKTIFDGSMQDSNHYLTKSAAEKAEFWRLLTEEHVKPISDVALSHLAAATVASGSKKKAAAAVAETEWLDSDTIHNYYDNLMQCAGFSGQIHVIEMQISYMHNYHLLFKNILAILEAYKDVWTHIVIPLNILSGYYGVQNLIDDEFSEAIAGSAPSIGNHWVVIVISRSKDSPDAFLSFYDSFGRVSEKKSSPYDFTDVYNISFQARIVWHTLLRWNLVDKVFKRFPRWYETDYKDVPFTVFANSARKQLGGTECGMYGIWYSTELIVHNTSPVDIERFKINDAICAELRPRFFDDQNDKLGDSSRGSTPAIVGVPPDIRKKYITSAAAKKATASKGNNSLTKQQLAALQFAPSPKWFEESVGKPRNDLHNKQIQFVYIFESKATAETYAKKTKEAFEQANDGVLSTKLIFMPADIYVTNRKTDKSEYGIKRYDDITNENGRRLLFKTFDDAFEEYADNSETNSVINISSESDE